MGIGFVSEYLTDDCEENLGLCDYESVKVIDGFLVYNNTLLDASKFKGATAQISSNEISTIGRGSFSKCKGVNSIVADEHITSVCSNAFCCMDEVAFVNLFNSEISTISRGCFVASHALKAVVFPRRVTEICSFAFYDCINLDTVDIPNSVDYIGDKAFGDCKSLKNLSFYRDPEYIHRDAFRGMTDVTVKIPPSCIYLRTYFLRNYPEFTVECFF